MYISVFKKPFIFVCAHYKLRQGDRFWLVDKSTVEQIVARVKKKINKSIVKTFHGLSIIICWMSYELKVQLNHLKLSFKTLTIGQCVIMNSNMKSFFIILLA